MDPKAKPFRTDKLLRALIDNPLTEAEKKSVEGNTALLRKITKRLVADLRPREREVLRMRFGDEELRRILGKEPTTTPDGRSDDHG